MSRYIVIWYMFLMLAMSASAREVSPVEALQRALAAIKDAGDGDTFGTKVENYSLLHTEMSAEGKALIYVYEHDNGALVFACADDRAKSVLGYTSKGNYKGALEISAFRGWLDNCRRAMQLLLEKGDAGHTAVRQDIKKQVFKDENGKGLAMATLGRRYNTRGGFPAQVSPLLKGIVWNQYAPYNRLCPVTQDGDTCLTGCVATATAQLMKYYEWPQRGEGTHSYTSATHRFYLSADFSASEYNWAKMLDDYDQGYSTTQANAVATLIKDIGIATDMNYDISSGTTSALAAYALAVYFKYSKRVQFCQREYYTQAEWNDMMKEELAAQRPIQVSGTNVRDDSGHSYIIDGYDKNGLYHVNWGWGGWNNGYFDLNLLNLDDLPADDEAYAEHTGIITNVRPDKDRSSNARYQLCASDEIVYDKSGFRCTLTNMGLGTYNGLIGFAAVMDNKVVGKYMYKITGFGYEQFTPMQCTLQQLGITKDMIGKKQCRVYPVYAENGKYIVPLSKAAHPDCQTLSVKKGQIVCD